MTSQDYTGSVSSAEAGMGSMNGDLAAVREDLARLRADIKSLMDSVGSIAAGSDAGTLAIRSINQAVGSVEEAAERAYNRLSEHTQTYATSFEKTVSEHPYGATAMALAAGMFISRMLDRPAR